MNVERIDGRLMVIIPDEVAERLGLKEGDSVGIERLGEPKLSSVAERAASIAEIRRLARPLPLDYRFDREEANARSKRVSDTFDGR